MDPLGFQLMFPLYSHQESFMNGLAHSGGWMGSLMIVAGTPAAGSGVGSKSSMSRGTGNTGTQVMSPAEAARIIPNAQRVSSAATKNDIFHRAPSYLTRQQLSQGRTSIMKNQSDGARRTLLEVDGTVNGQRGIFEFIIEPNGNVSHQLFRPHR